MKLSELSYKDVVNLLGEEQFSMPQDSTDALRKVRFEKDFVEAKEELMERFGDVEISVHPDSPWYDQVQIDDEKFKAAHEDFCNRKAEWCNKNGCD